jgi:hypothetical protein
MAKNIRKTPSCLNSGAYLMLAGWCVGTSCSEKSSEIALPPRKGSAETPILKEPADIPGSKIIADIDLPNFDQSDSNRTENDKPKPTALHVPGKPVAEILKVQRDKIESLNQMLEVRLKSANGSSANFNEFLKELRSYLPGVELQSTLRSDLANAEQICNRIEEELPNRKSKLSSQAYSVIENLLTKNRVEIDQLKTIQADYFARSTSVDEAADQWRLVYEEIKKLSGLETAQREVNSEIIRFLMSGAEASPRGTGWRSPQDYKNTKVRFGLMVTLNATGRPSDVVSGVKVESIFPESPSQQAGLQIGDVISRLDGQIIMNKGAFGQYCSSLKGGESVKVEFQRGNEQKTLKLIAGHVITIEKSKRDDQ